MKNSNVGKKVSSKKKGTKAITLALCTLTVTLANADNLLTNGDFESGNISPWTGDATISDARWDVDGLHAVKIEGTVSQKLTVAPYSTYRLAATVMPYSGSITMGVEGTDLQTTTPLQTAVSGSESAGTELTRKTSLVFTTGRYTKEITIYFSSDSSESSNTAYADDVVLELIPDYFDHYHGDHAIPLTPIEENSAPNLLRNSGFEDSYLLPWYYGSWGNAGEMTLDPLQGEVTPAGNTVVKVVGKGSCYQYVTVKPNTSYRYTALSYNESLKISLGVKGSGTTEKFTINTLEGAQNGWMKHELLFTTGNTNQLKVYAYVPNSNGVAYIDNLELREAAHQGPFTPSGKAPTFPGYVLAEYYDGVWIDGKLIDPQGISCYTKTEELQGAGYREKGRLKMYWESMYTGTMYEPISYEMAVFLSGDEWAEYTVKLDEKSSDWTFKAGVQTYDSGMQLEFSINGEVLGTKDIKALFPWTETYSSDSRYPSVGITVPQSVMKKYEGQEVVIRLKVLGNSGQCKIYRIFGE